MQKIDELKEPPKIGEFYLVPTFIHFDKIYGTRFIAPLINHLHNDKENDQHEPHYHVDTRFIDRNRKPNPDSIDDWFFFKRVYPHEYENFKFEYYLLECFNDKEEFITHPYLIRKSKIKHNCIHKGKCPHRGYDLSQVIPVDGIITCPLHGLKFDSLTKNIIQ